MKHTILIFLLFISAVLQGQIVVYPVPQEMYYAMHNDDFTVQVRTSNGDWQDLYEYKVEVDADSKSVASMVQFDFRGKIEIRVKVNNGSVNNIKIRPLQKNIVPKTIDNVVYFSLENPTKLSFEVNGDRLHNLHIFANPITTENFLPTDKDVIYFGKGVHIPSDSIQKAFIIPSNKTVYIDAGAIVCGKFLCENVENVRFAGRGFIYNAERGFELKFCKNIEIDGVTVINPRHYTVYGGQTTGLKINNLKSFSNRGWSDGIDLMSCSNVAINDVFMRNSDDCIALYTHRWDFYGDAKNYNITNAILWADIAHPINIGLHGDTSHEGNVIENIRFSEIDILEHDEDDRNYQGCMAFSVSDHNLVQNVSFENIRVENIQEGQLLNLRVLYNQKYSSGAGRGIRNISFKNIYYNGYGENPSIIEGYSDRNHIENVKFENIIVNGTKIETLEEGNIRVGKFTKNITIE